MWRNKLSGIFNDRKLLLFTLICAGISIYFFFYHLGKAPLENWDEAWYGEATREMLRTHNLIALHWDRMLWLDKPPLQIWINSILSLVFGLSEFSIRLVSAISAFLISMGVAIYSYKKFGLTPAILGFGTLILNNVFVWRSRSGNLDLLVSVLVFGTYFILLWRNKYKYSILGLLFAAIFLTKTSVVLLPLLIFFLHEFFFEYKNVRANIKEYAKLLFFFIMPVTVWLGLGYLREGWEFAHYYLFNSDQGVGAIKSFNPNYISYAYYMLQRRFFYLFLIGIAFLLLSVKRRENFLLLLFGLLLVLELSLTQRSNNWYLLPAMSFWSITVAYGAYSLLKMLRNNKIIILGVLVTSGYLFLKTYNVNILPILNPSAVTDQSQSAKVISRLSSPDDTIVRLDPLCPTTIFYSDRKVFCSVSAVNQTNNYWMSREDVISRMQKNEIKWVVGTNADYQSFVQNSLLPIKEVYSNSAESVGKLGN